MWEGRGRQNMSVAWIQRAGQHGIRYGCERFVKFRAASKRSTTAVARRVLVADCKTTNCILMAAVYFFRDGKLSEHSGCRCAADFPNLRSGGCAACKAIQVLRTAASPLSPNAGCWIFRGMTAVFRMTAESNLSPVLYVCGGGLKCSQVTEMLEVSFVLHLEAL